MLKLLQSQDSKTLPPSFGYMQNLIQIQDKNNQKVDKNL